MAIALHCYRFALQLQSQLQFLRNECSIAVHCKCLGIALQLHRNRLAVVFQLVYNNYYLCPKIWENGGFEPKTWEVRKWSPRDGRYLRRGRNLIVRGYISDLQEVGLCLHRSETDLWRSQSDLKGCQVKPQEMRSENLGGHFRTSQVLGSNLHISQILGQRK